MGVFRTIPTIICICTTCLVHQQYSVHSDAIDVDSWPQPTIVMTKKNLRTMQINVLTCCKIDSEPS